MAKTDFPLNIDRRRLLVSAAALPAAGFVPGVKGIGPADATCLPPTAVPALNVCAATARRLLEIARRNELRHEAGLPLLPVVPELRKMKRQEDLQEFERFKAVQGKAVLEEILKGRREAEGNPNWRPRWIDVVGYQNEVRQILRQQFQATAACYADTANNMR